MSKRIVVLVSNDLTYDRRVEKTCDVWVKSGWSLTLIGVRKSDSQPLNRNYNTLRLSTFFSKGPLFYAVLQCRLFFFLFFRRFDVIWSNDLDTLLPARLVGWMKRTPVIYDSHELFTEAEGLTGRPVVKSIWRWIESQCFPGLQRVMTVNDSIAAIFKARYGNQVQVVRNVPTESKASIDGVAVDLPDGDKIILQGAYIDPDRGGEELVEAMAYIPQVHLLVVGSGRAIADMKASAGANVTFLDRVPHEQLKAITRKCLLGLSLDKPTHDNYKFSLPNKLFDYWQSGIPVLASPMVEVEKLVLKYNAGQILRSWSPKEMANQILEMLHSDDYATWKKNAVQAAQENTWEREVRVIEQWIVELS